MTLAHGAVIHEHIVLGMYAVDLGTALHACYGVEQRGMVLDIGGYGVSATLGKSNLNQFVIGVTIGIHIATR